MSIRVFHTPFKFRGFTEELFRISSEGIKDSDYSKTLYLAPTPWKIQESRRIFHIVAGKCYIPPDMLTIKQLAIRLQSVYDRNRLISQNIVPVIISLLTSKGIGLASLIGNFIEEIKQYHPDNATETVRKEITDIFHGLGIADEVAGRALEAIDLFEAYEHVISCGNAVDDNDAVALCPKFIEKHGSPHEILILDGFYELTRAQQAVIKELIRRSRETLISIPYDRELSFYTNPFVSFLNHNFTIQHVNLDHTGTSREISYHPYTSMEEEAEGIARSIKNHYISGQISDLGKTIVIFPSLAKYADMVERVFMKYGIPCSVLRERPLGKTRPLLDLIALLEAVTDDYPRLPFCQFLTSPYFKNLSPLFRRYIPDLSLTAWIVKGKETWMNLSARGHLLHKDRGVPQEELRTLEKEIGRVFRKLSPLETIRYSGSYSKYSEVIEKILIDLDFSYDQNQGIDVKETVRDILKELSFMDNISTYASLSAQPGLWQFTEAFTYVLNASETEKEIAGVRIMDLIDASGIEPDYLYFGGLRDGDFPAKPATDHLLPDSVRRRLGLVDFDTYLALQKFLFTRALQSAKNIYLSYPETDGDRIFLPSSFLPWNRQSQQVLCGIFSSEEQLVREGKIPLASRIKEIEDVKSKALLNKFSEEAFFRVTDIDAYRTCPRKFFVERLLRVEPAEIKKYEIEAALLGSIAHEIMQAFIAGPFTDLDDFSQRAAWIMERVLSDKPLDDYWKSVVRDSFLKILPDIFKLEKKIAGEGYTFMGSEVPVQGEVIKGIRLKGTIDRIDRRVVRPEEASLTIKHSGFDTLVELIDYKTGSSQFSGTQVLSRGSTLQLFLYASLIKSLGLTAERAGIYSLKDMKISWIPGRNDRKKGRTIEDYVGASLRFLEETVSEMRNLKFPARPLNDQICRTCPERSYCPYIQKAP